MKITLKFDNWRPGKIQVYGTMQTIHAESKAGPVMLVYERDQRNPRSYTFRGVQRSRPDPASQFAGDLPPLIEHLPWDAVPRATWQRAMAAEQQRRSYHDDGEG